MTGVYDLFLSRVAEGRHTSVDAIAPFAEGRIFSGAQGQEHGLVDEIGGLSAAIARARSLAKLPADAEVETVGGNRGVWATLGGAAASRLPSAGAPAPADLRDALARLAPGLVPFATAYVPLVEGERALAAVPFALVVR